MCKGRSFRQELTCSILLCGLGSAYPPVDQCVVNRREVALQGNRKEVRRASSLLPRYLGWYMQAKHRLAWKQVVANPQPHRSGRRANLESILVSSDQASADMPKHV